MPDETLYRSRPFDQLLTAEQENRARGAPEKRQDRRSEMSSDRRLAIVAGVLIIVGFADG
jgi:hypothetical protein